MTDWAPSDYYAFTHYLRDRLHWFRLATVPTGHGTYAVVLEMDGYYPDKADADAVRDAWAEEFNIPVGFRSETDMEGIRVPMWLEKRGAW